MPNAEATLETIEIRNPCPAAWEDMTGNERTRFCAQCRLNVYNLSGMSRGEAEDLIRRTEGRVCVRFYRRRDGMVLTADCSLRERIARRAGALLSTALGLLGLGAALSALGGCAGRHMGMMCLPNETQQKKQDEKPDKDKDKKAEQPPAQLPAK